MIREATADDRAEFMVLWAEFLRDAHKAGAELLPTPNNLMQMMKIFDAYVSGELEGTAKIAPGIGVTLGGELQRGQVMDSSLGRIATGWGTYVREEHRGQGWSRKLREAGAQRCKELGYDVVVGPIALTNEVSLQSCKNLGVELVGVVAAYRLEG